MVNYFILHCSFFAFGWILTVLRDYREKGKGTTLF